MSAKGKRFSIEKLRKTLMGAKVYHETRGKGEIIGLSDMCSPTIFVVMFYQQNRSGKGKLYRNQAAQSLKPLIRLT